MIVGVAGVVGRLLYCCWRTLYVNKISYCENNLA